MLVHHAPTGAGAGRGQYHQHSTGDGYIFSIDPHVPRTMLLTELLDGLHQRLTSFNRRKLRAEQVRVRLAIHGGEVLRDPDPLEGAAIWEGIIRHDTQGSQPPRGMW